MVKKNKNESRNIKVLMLSAVLMLLLNFLLLKNFDLISSLIYLALAALFGSILGMSKYSSANYLLFGALLSIIYNLGFSMVGLFTVSTTFVLLAAIQQALLGFLSSEIIGGGKK